MRFVYLDSRFMLHASFPRSVTLTQLRFASLAVASSREDLHLQDRAHAGRTRKKGSAKSAAPVRGCRADVYRAHTPVVAAEPDKRALFDTDAVLYVRTHA